VYTKLLDKTGERVSELGVGTWGMGGYEQPDTSNDDLYVKAIRENLEAGFKLIDTAEMYASGHSEELVGKAIKGAGINRDDLFIISKVWHTHLSHDDLIKAAKRSVERLGTYVDLYMVHWPDPYVPLQETMRSMEEVVDMGLARYIGVSNFSAELLDEAISSTAKYEVVADQVKYSITDRSAERDVLPYCERNALALIAYTPIEHGKVASGKIGQALETVGKKYGKTPVQVALNWLTYHEPVFAIPKALKREHILENAGASDWRLSSQDFEYLSRTSTRDSVDSLTLNFTAPSSCIMEEKAERGVVAGLLSGLVYSALVTGFGWIVLSVFPSHAVEWYADMPFMPAPTPNFALLSVVSFSAGALMSFFFVLYSDKLPGTSSIEKGVFLSLWLMDTSSAALAVVCGQQSYFYVATPAVFFAPVYGVLLGLLFDELKPARKRSTAPIRHNLCFPGPSRGDTLMASRPSSPMNVPLEEYRDFAVTTMKQMIPVKAISPAAGGKGEGERLEMLLSTIAKNVPEASVVRLDALDPTGTTRPNALVRLDAGQPKTLWIMAHMDTVSEGDRSAWRTDPFQVVEDDDKLYGRGTLDNGQSLVSGIVTMLALRGKKMRYNYALALLSDEETGSTYGLKHVVKNWSFSPQDLYVVPDAGTEDGSTIEIAEKGIAWLKIISRGLQTHASTPALNANRMAMEALLEMDRRLHQKYVAHDPLFMPPCSTFEPTKREPNVASINIVPGTDISYMDCRILPSYRVQDVLEDASEVAAYVSKKYGGKVEVQPISLEEPAPPTDPRSEVAVALSESIKRVRGINPKFVGIGGGTVAAVLRRAGLQAVVWSTVVETAHQPNEYCRVSDLLADAAVFYDMIASE